MSSDLKHIGLIPDGARRWARQNKTRLESAYLQTMEKIAQAISLFFDHGAIAVSVYLLSADNLRKRPDDDLKSVIASETHLVEVILPPLIREYDCKATLAGQRSLLPPPFAATFENLESDSSGCGTRRLYLLAGYDAWLEITDAIQRACCDKDPRDHLWVPEEVDAVFRTGGEQRFSGFLPLQSRYAEIKFFPDLFLDVTTQCLELAISDLSGRNRRFGE